MVIASQGTIQQWMQCANGLLESLTKRNFGQNLTESSEIILDYNVHKKFVKP